MMRTNKFLINKPAAPGSPLGRIPPKHSLRRFHLIMAIQGIIKPPPDIRAVADKTALFVAKNGRAFESRILNSEKGKTPKFSFLHDTSPFHAYYEDRISFYENGGTDEAAASSDKGEEKIENKPSDQPQQPSPEPISGTITSSTSDSAPDKTSARKAKSTIDPIALALLSQRSRILELDSEDKESRTDNGGAAETHHIGLKQPIKFSFADIHVPYSITPAQTDIIKLTAQFTAMNGKGGTFLRDLTIREWNNYTVFGFLQPRHEHFAYFSSLVDLYRRLLASSLLTYDQYNAGLSVLERAVLSEMIGLDTWSSDDTIVSTKDDVLKEQDHIKRLSHSVGNCLDEVAYRIEFDRHTEDKRQGNMDDEDTGGRLIGGASQIDWQDFVVVETIDFPIHEVVEVLPPPPPLALPTTTSKSLKLRQLYQQHKAMTEKIADDGSAMYEDDNDADMGEEQLNIVPEADYRSKVVSTTSAITHVIDPITKRSIPIQDMSEHMRIQLLDPKWAEEKKKFMEKQKDSNFVEGDLIAKNISSFAKTVFGSSSVSNVTNYDDSNPKNSDLNQANAPDPSITLSTMPPFVPGIPSLGPIISQPYFTDPQGLFLQGQPFNITNDAVTSSIEPQIKKPRLEESETNLLPKSDGNIDDDDKETNAVDSVITNYVPMSEADFIKSLDDPNVTIRIAIPNDPSNKSWNLNGQCINFSVNVMTKIKVIKEKLQTQLGMPVNKMQLRTTTMGFLKDATTLAFCNIGNMNPSIELVPKTRGGRK